MARHPGQADKAAGGWAGQHERARWEAGGWGFVWGCSMCHDLKSRLPCPSSHFLTTLTPPGPTSPTEEVLFSYDSGKCWQSVPLAEALLVDNIRCALPLGLGLGLGPGT